MPISALAPTSRRNISVRKTFRILGFTKANLREKIRHLLIKSNRLTFLFFLSKLYYHIGISSYLKFVSPCVTGIRGVCVRNSFSTGDWIPWESDIDLTVVLHDLAHLYKEAAVLSNFWRYHRVMRGLFPFIQHVVILCYRQCKDPIIFQDPTLTNLVQNIKVMKGLDASDFPLSPKENIYSLPIDNWMDYFALICKPVRTHTIYLRKLERFFNRCALLLPRTEHTLRLKRLIGEKKNYDKKNGTLQFAYQGFYYINNIVASMHKRAVKQTALQSKFRHKVILEATSESLLKLVHDFSKSLNQYHNAISGICVDKGSILSSNPRIWVTLRSGIDEYLWAQALGSIRQAHNKICPQIAVYIFDISALEVLLHTQRHWIFEQSHLANHALTIMGDNFFLRMHKVPDTLILRMALSDIVYKSILLRNYSFTASFKKLYRFAYEIFRLKVLGTTNTLVTTFKELMAASQELDKIDGFDSIIASILDQRMPRQILYAKLSTYALKVQEEFCAKMPNYLIENAADYIYSLDTEQM